MARKTENLTMINDFNALKKEPQGMPAPYTESENIDNHLPLLYISFNLINIIVFIFCLSHMFPGIISYGR